MIVSAEDIIRLFRLLTDAGLSPGFAAVLVDVLLRLLAGSF